MLKHNYILFVVLLSLLPYKGHAEKVLLQQGKFPFQVTIKNDHNWCRKTIDLVFEKKNPGSFSHNGNMDLKPTFDYVSSMLISACPPIEHFLIQTKITRIHDDYWESSISNQWVLKSRSKFVTTYNATSQNKIILNKGRFPYQASILDQNNWCSSEIKIILENNVYSLLSPTDYSNLQATVEFLRIKLRSKCKKINTVLVKRIIEVQQSGNWKSSKINQWNLEKFSSTLPKKKVSNTNTTVPPIARTQNTTNTNVATKPVQSQRKTSSRNNNFVFICPNGKSYSLSNYSNWFPSGIAQSTYSLLSTLDVTLNSIRSHLFVFIAFSFIALLFWAFLIDASSDSGGILKLSFALFIRIIIFLLISSFTLYLFNFDMNSNSPFTTSFCNNLGQIQQADATFISLIKVLIKSVGSAFFVLIAGLALFSPTAAFSLTGKVIIDLFTSLINWLVSTSLILIIAAKKFRGI